VPHHVCSVCLAQKSAGKEIINISVGYLTMIDGTYYCEEHLPKVFVSRAVKLPLREGPKVYKPPKRKRGRPKKV